MVTIERLKKEIITGLYQNMLLINMIKETDIFNLDNPNSIVRRLIESQKEINLENLVQKRIQIPIDYELKELNIQSGESNEINSLIEKEIKKFSEIGYPENIYTPIYEAIRNAYQQGNKNNSGKKVRFAYKIGQANLNILVEDEGKIIDSAFAPFILKHREGNNKKKFINFYEFSGTEKPKTNNGTGTAFIHAYMDEVNYFLGEYGLIVHMIKNKH